MRLTASRLPLPRPLRTIAPLLLALATIGLLALLPTARAHASTPAVSVPSAEGVETLLAGTPVGALPSEQLAEAISQLNGLEGAEPQKLKETIDQLIASLTSGTTLGELLGKGESTAELQSKLEELLGPLASKLEELLGANPAAKLSEALQSAGGAEVLGKLLGLSSEPQTVIQQLLAALNPEQLQNLLGTLPTGGPFSASTVEELAGKLSTTPAALASELGKNAESLPGQSMALTGPLANGETLAVLNGLDGVTLGLIKGTGETTGLTGGTGAPGGSGSGGAPGAPGSTVTVTTPPPAAGVAAAKTGKLRLISHRVKGATATVVVEVPAAGKLAGRGSNVRSMSRDAAKAERITLHPALVRKASAAVRKHHKHVKVPFTVTFTPVGGHASSVKVNLSYR